MTPLEKLEGGDRRSLGRAAEVVRDVLADPTLFEEVFGGMWDSDPMVCLRVADVVEKISRTRPEWLAPFKRLLLDQAARVEQIEVRWHIARMLPRLKLTRSERAEAAAIASVYFGGKSNIVKVMALQAFADLAAEGDRAMREESARRIDDALRSGSPAVRARARKLLKGPAREGW